MVGRTTIERFIPAACATLALCAAVAALVPVLRPVGWNLTALPRVAANTGMGAAARARDPGFRTVTTGSYDGQFYWGIAVDPIATGDVHQSFDTASYRYGHPLLGWLGWLLSAGQARAAPAALLAVGLASLALAALAASLLGRTFGGRGLAGLFVAVNPGLIYSAAHDLTEPLSAALLLGGFLAYARGRRALAAVCFGLLVLSKEQFLLVPLGVAAWEVLRRRGRLLESGIFVACLLPAAGWWIYARLQLGDWFTSGGTALGTPLAGWKRALLDAGINTYSSNAAQNIASEAALVVLAALLSLLAFAGLLALRVRGPADVVYLLLAAVAACLVPMATVLQRDALRNVSVLLTLVPFVSASVPLLPPWSRAPQEE
ncbi:MAG TPA: hypothetical protein VNY33_05010 [Gaiellaceae bacterium]|nr:hypothetical protein [Gaiellaceae bacterium]